MQRLGREIRALFAAPNRPNITPLLGIAADFDPSRTPCLVSPYYRHGNVMTYIREHPNVDKLAMVSHICKTIGHPLFSVAPDCADCLCVIVLTHPFHHSWGCEGSECFR